MTFWLWFAIINIVPMPFVAWFIVLRQAKREQDRVNMCNEVGIQPKRVPIVWDAEDYEGIDE